jgi:hypothetical protein
VFVWVEWLGLSPAAGALVRGGRGLAPPGCPHDVQAPGPSLDPYKNISHKYFELLQTKDSTYGGGAYGSITTWWNIGYSVF